MAKRANRTIIGTFVAGAILLTIVAAVIWGSRELFERKYEYICYFPGSVNGLTTGAPVKYRGVEVGLVKDVRVRYHQAPHDTRIPVVIEIWGKRLRELGGEREPTPEMITDLVGQGLRARLETLSLVTGVLYVSLDLTPDSPLSYAEQPGKGALPEIPTLPTEFEEVQKSVLDVLKNLKNADVKGVSDSIAQTAAAADRLLSSPELLATIKELRHLIAEVRDLTTTLDANSTKTMAALRGTLESATGAISPDAPLLAHLKQTLSDVDKAANAFRELSEFLRRNPHAIVAGTKPRGAAQ
jgi:paraquat-inducible protein B